MHAARRRALGMQDYDALRGDFGIAGIVSAGTAELLTEHDNSGQTDIDYFLHSRTARFLHRLRRLPLRQTDCWEWGAM